MKHKCKEMIELQKSIKEFNKNMENGVDDTIHLSMRIRDSHDDYGGIIFDWLFYKRGGKKQGENMFYCGSGMRFLYCPFCGHNLAGKFAGEKKYPQDENMD